MKNYFLLIFTSSLVIFFFSCKDEAIDLAEVDKPTTFEEYFQILGTPTDGAILIQSSGTPFSDSRAYNVNSRIKGDRMPFGLDLNGEKISFKDYYFSKLKNISYAEIDQNDLSDVYGGYFNFEVVQLGSEVFIKTAPSKKGENGSIYIPELIQAQITNLSNGNIVAGTTITWNVDPDNENGVILGVEYCPLSQTDSTIRDLYPERSLNGITLSESGSYVVKAEDLLHLPNEARVTLYVGRAGIGITTFGPDNQTFSVAGYTLFSSYQYIAR